MKVIEELEQNRDVCLLQEDKRYTWIPAYCMNVCVKQNLPGISGSVDLFMPISHHVREVLLRPCIVLEAFSQAVPRSLGFGHAWSPLPHLSLSKKFSLNQIIFIYFLCIEIFLKKIIA